MMHGTREDLRTLVRRLGSVLLVSWLVAIPRPGLAEETETANAPPGELEFVGRNLFSKARGTFHDWRIVDASVDIDRLDEAFALVEVQLDSVDTGIDRRDEHLRTEDFFETGTYPVARVRVHSPRARPSKASETSEEQRFAVRFDVDLHGVQKTLDGEVRLVGSDPVVFEGDLVLDRTDFGIGDAPSGWNPMAPKAEIPVTFRVELGPATVPGVSGS
jgi:polyisoprenoid-binding protein YceI